MGRLNIKLNLHFGRLSPSHMRWILHRQAYRCGFGFPENVRSVRLLEDSSSEGSRSCITKRAHPLCPPPPLHVPFPLRVSPSPTDGVPSSRSAVSALNVITAWPSVIIPSAAVVGALGRRVLVPSPLLRICEKNPNIPWVMAFAVRLLVAPATANRLRTMQLVVVGGPPALPSTSAAPHQAC